MKKLLPYHNRPRSIGAQISRMKMLWPRFNLMKRTNTEANWVGCLRGFQRFYTVGVIWGVKGLDRPYVFLINPILTPREDSTFEDIPHLMYDSKHPERSGLCLFDPDGKEWIDHMLIADTTIPWAAKWLYFYELWHDDGKWRGGGVGAESIAGARREALHTKKEEQSSSSTKETSMAAREAIQDFIT